MDKKITKQTSSKTLLCGIAIWAASFAAMNVHAQPGTYNPGDIAVINNIIDSNGLNWTKANPADGSYIPADWANWACQWTGDATNKRITHLEIWSKALTGTLNVSGLENLKYLDFGNNLLTTLNVSGLKNLEYLQCVENLLTTLDVLGLENLQTIECSRNQLTTLNVSGLENLQGIACDRNQLTMLNVSGLENFQWLECNYNQMTELNVSGLVNFQRLYCDNNQLTTLNVSGLENLQVLWCQNNQLTELDLTGLNSLYIFRGEDQMVSLTMESNGTNYTAAIALNSPNLTVFAAGITYNSDTLTSTSNTIASSAFEVETGNVLYKLSGTLNFTYLELYTVTFAGEAISGIPTQSIVHGRKVTKPADPERTSYDFGGWFTDNGTFLNKWNFATNVVTQDTTLWAKWTEKTGIVEIESASIKIYPNPVKEKLQIESGDLTIRKVEILDITGKIVENSTNVSALSSGIYFVRLETDKGIITRKFVKE